MSEANGVNLTDLLYAVVIEMKNEWLVAAKQSLENAKRELVYAARAFERTDGPFEQTIKEIKENIGDLEMSIEALKDEGI